jgi:hypothetical protein
MEDYGRSWNILEYFSNSEKIYLIIFIYIFNLNDFSHLFLILDYPRRGIIIYLFLILMLPKKKTNDKDTS